MAVDCVSVVAGDAAQVLGLWTWKSGHDGERFVGERKVMGLHSLRETLVRIGLDLGREAQ